MDKLLNFYKVLIDTCREFGLRTAANFILGGSAGFGLYGFALIFVDDPNQAYILSWTAVALIVISALSFCIYLLRVSWGGEL